MDLPPFVSITLPLHLQRSVIGEILLVVVDPCRLRTICAGAATIRIRSKHPMAQLGIRQV
jgi:hypothetical protein